MGTGRNVFFSHKLHDRKIAFAIEQIAKGGTATSAQMTRRQRRAEVLELLDAEIDTARRPAHYRLRKSKRSKRRDANWLA